MSTEITKIDPKEFGLDENQGTKIENEFAPVISERNGIAEIYQQIITAEITPELCERAGKLSTALSKVNASLERVHKANKAYFLSGGRFVDAIKNKNEVIISEMQINLKKISQHFILIEQERITKLETERTELLKQYTEIIPMSLGLMQEDVFQAYLAAQKKIYDERIAAEKQAELDRIAREKAEAEERERIRIENERLKKEAEEREKAIEAERIEAEKKLAAERAEAAAKQKAIEDAARVEREKAEAELAELAAELKVKADAEAAAKAEAERIEQERIAAANKAAKAPDKDKLKAFVNSITLPELPELKSAETKAVAAVVTEKFKAFKIWAEQQIENV